MLLLKQILLVIFYLFSPLLVLYLTHRYRFVNKLGAVVMAYLIGLLLGNLPILPEGSQSIQNTITAVVIPLAIPLMLFSANLKEVMHLARRTMISMLIGMFSVTVIVVMGYFTLRGQEDDLWKIAGMLIGVYTGGTPNLASLKFMLGVDDTHYLITHTSDLIISGAYFFFLISIGQRVFNWVLPVTPKGTHQTDDYTQLDGTDPYWGMLKRDKYLPLMKAFALAVAIFAVAGGASFLFPESYQVPVVMLLITTLGLAASFVPAFNRIEKSFELGMYLVLVFSVVVASMVSIPDLINGAPTLFYYVTMVIFGSLILQVILSRIFKIDTDTVIITSTALICSPPFVPVVAGALNNRRIVVPGLTVGIIGYAVGNYLGFVVAELLKNG